MRISEVHNCQCVDCSKKEDHPNKKFHYQMNLFLSRLNEQQRRWYVALEANHIGHGGIRLLSKITGINGKTIQRGQKEMNQNIANRPIKQIRQKGGGRQRVETKMPSIEFELGEILDKGNEIAGDPMTEQKWVRSSMDELSRRLEESGHKVCPSTISRLLKGMDFSMKANKRRQAHTNNPHRDSQFKFIATQRESFTIAEFPIISVDTKKKELIGDFVNSGRTWRRQAEEVNEHDFPSEALCKAVPYGIYDVTKNLGFVFVGISCDTPEFAVDNIVKWWRLEGQNAYPNRDKILILSDSGGSNGCRSRFWKLCLQEKMSDQFGLAVTVCHYPTGCSKWNPVEHRLFSYISINWAGKPLKTLDIMLAYIRGTKTKTGLEVQAFLQDHKYNQGQVVSQEMMKNLNIEYLLPCPKWSYTIHPRQMVNKELQS